MNRIGKHMRKHIYSFVPACYRPIVRQTFSDAPAMDHLTQRNVLRQLARDDALNCIQYHEQVNHWNLAFGLTEIALKSGASVETIIYLLEKDYRISAEDFSQHVVVMNRLDVFKALPEYPWSNRMMLYDALEYDRVWALEWCTKPKEMKPYLETIIPFEFGEKDDFVIPCDCVRWLLDNDMLASPLLQTIYDSMVFHLSWTESWHYNDPKTGRKTADNKLKIESLCRRIGYSLSEHICNHIAAYSDELDTHYLRVFQRCECDHPERHR